MLQVLVRRYVPSGAGISKGGNSPSGKTESELSILSACTLTCVDAQPPSASHPGVVSVRMHVRETAQVCVVDWRVKLERLFGKFVVCDCVSAVCDARSGVCDG